MVDPHTKESRGFGFVKMVTADQADAAKEGLQGESIDGRTLSIEKARRARPRTPTPGKYFGPPKRGTSFAGLLPISAESDAQRISVVHLRVAMTAMTIAAVVVMAAATTILTVPVALPAATTNAIAIKGVVTTSVMTMLLATSTAMRLRVTTVTAAVVTTVVVVVITNARADVLDIPLLRLPTPSRRPEVGFMKIARMTGIPGDRSDGRQK